MTRPKIILASGSAIRREILSAAGIAFDVMRPDVDEDFLKKEAAARNLDLEETAMRLAEAKCLAVSDADSDLVIGSDQILEFKGAAFDKPKDMAEARARLAKLSGQKHTLINAVAVARNGEIVWRHIDRPALFMRDLSDEELDAYFETAGDDILSSVGAYQIEKLGSRLFENIDGSHFAVLGLSLFPLLGFLRREGAVAF